MQTDLSAGRRLIGSAAALPISEKVVSDNFLAQILDSGFRPLTRPGDEAQLMSLIQVGMGGDNANIKSITSALSSFDDSLKCELPGRSAFFYLLKINCKRFAERSIVALTNISLHPNMRGVNRT